LRKVEVENNAYKVVLFVGTLAGIVLVLVVGFKLNVSSHREEGTHIEICGAPLVVLTLVERFSCDVGDQMVGEHWQSPLQGQFVAIAPVENAILALKVRTVAVCNQDSSHEWKVRDYCFLCPIRNRRIRSGDDAVSSLMTTVLDFESSRSKVVTRLSLSNGFKLN